MTDKGPRETARLIIDLDSIPLPLEVARKIAEGMARVATEALAGLDLAPTRGNDVLPPGDYGYMFDEKVPGGPWPPEPRPLDDNPF